MAYSDKVLDHYENPRNVGTFDKEDTTVGTGMVGAPACGDVMNLQIKVNNDGVKDQLFVRGHDKFSPIRLFKFVKVSYNLLLIKFL